MANYDFEHRERATRGPNSDDRETRNAAPHGDSRAVNGSDQQQAGDEHYAQYGMRGGRNNDQGSDKERGGYGSAARNGGVEAFDEEYRTREARDKRPRSIPTGVADKAVPPGSDEGSESAHIERHIDPG